MTDEQNRTGDYTPYTPLRCVSAWRIFVLLQRVVEPDPTKAGRSNRRPGLVSLRLGYLAYEVGDTHSSWAARARLKEIRRFTQKS